VGSYKTSDLIKEIRNRKALRQADLVTYGEAAACAIYRLENNSQHPTDGNLNEFMSQLSIPLKNFFCPYLEDLPSKIYEVRETLADSLDNPNISRAEECIAFLEETEGFDEGLNLQFLLNCKARSAVLRGEDFEKILNYIEKGMNITYPEFDPENFQGGLLLFNEAELVHTLALAYGKNENVRQAIAILKTAEQGMNLMLEDDSIRQRKHAKIICSLAKSLAEEGAYQAAFDFCEKGTAVALNYTKGRDLHELTYFKALCSAKLAGGAEDCFSLLRQVFFGYLLLDKRDAALWVKSQARDLFGFDIETYGAADLPRVLPPYSAPFKRGARPKSKSVGQLIGMLRVNAGITQSELARGICSVSELSRIENGKITANIYYLEAFMQKLGRDIDEYVDTFLNEREFDNKQTRDMITSLISQKRADEAGKLIEKLENEKHFKKDAGLQFIISSRASVRAIKIGYDQECLAMIYDAIHVTLPEFDEWEIEKYYLTNLEIQTIGELANGLRNTGGASEIKRAVKIHESLLENMDRHYEDEHEKIKLYTVLLHNCSNCLVDAGRYAEALETVDEGWQMELKHKRFQLTPGFAMTRADALVHLGQKEMSVPYFAMAYYGFLLLREQRNAESIKKYAEENLDIRLF